MKNKTIIYTITIITMYLLLLSHFSSTQDYGISGTWYYGETPTHIRVEYKDKAAE